MKRINIENGLAIVGAVIVLVGVFSAAESALADDKAVLERTTQPVAEAASRNDAKDTADTSDSAEKNADEHAEMAREAADAIREANLLDLDIQLRNPTSIVDART
ncbi:MAG: hypothetical protein AAFX56_03320 [Pseudomonadota bacterium]